MDERCGFWPARARRRSHRRWPTSRREDHLVLSDQFTTIKAESNEFDVVEKICTSFDAISGCHWDNGNNNIHVDAAAPPAGASLGIGFVGDQDFSCSGGTAALGSTLIYINPRDYPPTDTTPRSMALTFDKTIKGTSGNTSAFVVCISKTNGEAGSWLGPIPTAQPPRRHRASRIADACRGTS